MALSFSVAVSFKQKTEKEKEKRKDSQFQASARALEFVSVIEQRLDKEIEAGHLGPKSDGDWTNVVSVTVKDDYNCNEVSGKLLADEVKKILESIYLPLGWEKVEVNWNYYECEGKTLHNILLEGV